MEENGLLDELPLWVDESELPYQEGTTQAHIHAQIDFDDGWTATYHHRKNPAAITKVLAYGDLDYTQAKIVFAESEEEEKVEEEGTQREEGSEGWENEEEQEVEGEYEDVEQHEDWEGGNRDEEENFKMGK